MPLEPTGLRVLRCISGGRITGRRDACTSPEHGTSFLKDCRWVLKFERHRPVLGSKKKKTNWIGHDRKIDG